jgi:catechol 2,3-dioxygenase-like lactoylglutathione lyase family enzyme
MSKFHHLITLAGLLILTTATMSNSQTNASKMKDANPSTTGNQVWVRYIVNDVKESVDFYTTLLGFKIEIQPPSGGFAQLVLGNLTLLINRPGAGGAGKTLADNSVPSPGGWNRIQIRVPDLEKKIVELKSQNATFRNEMIAGNGGKQILLQDPSGNLIELFEPYK